MPENAKGRMKLDRNTNPDGRGKYGLLKLRRLAELKTEDERNYSRATTALDMLQQLGVIHWGDEGPGEQFFVMKWKDKFTPPALQAYMRAVREEAIKSKDMAQVASLVEYADQLFAEYAGAKAVANRIPD